MLRRIPIEYFRENGLGIGRNPCVFLWPTFPFLIQNSFYLFWWNAFRVGKFFFPIPTFPKVSALELIWDWRSATLPVTLSADYLCVKIVLTSCNRTDRGTVIRIHCYMLWWTNGIPSHTHTHTLWTVVIIIVRYYNILKILRSISVCRTITILYGMGKRLFLSSFPLVTLGTPMVGTQMQEMLVGFS